MSDNVSNRIEYTVTTKELSEILNLSPRRIQQLTKESALVRSARGKYDLPSSIQAYIEYMNEVPDEELDKVEEETLWTRARRQKAELELKIMQGEVHRSEDVESVMNDMLGAFRSQLLVIPGKVAPQLIAETDVEVIKDTVKKYVYEAMQELADYDPHVFYAKSKDRLSIDGEIKEIDGGEKEEKAGKGPRNNGRKEKE
ncbi:hypothetical protein [Virgibacillus halodenitrificans]|uniref:hypothetical protein n=1 Tax=Virgibacillus halodenitrificans TaxID=1482 RepID=UPI000EF493F7|nr:hypothetical protein [Virgibacillus halodenitrificans]